VADSRASEPQAAPDSDLAAVDRLVAGRRALLAEVAKAIIGHEEVVDELLIAMFCEGHCLFVGVPGLGKTLLVRTVAQALDLSFSRIQFTPDLMPSDITGTDIIYDDPATGQRSYRFLRGPVFANVLLADEINRTPPKTQSALLQAMQERQVTAGGETHSLPLPFLVLATQNPIEQEGTYPLPEAQLDRFMFNVRLFYPSAEEEMRIVAATTSAYEAQVNSVLNAADVLRLQHVVRGVPVGDHVLAYAVRLARATRPGEAGSPDFVNSWVTWGAGPRASQTLILGAKARALMHGRLAASREDVRALALPALRHRIIPSFAAEAEGVDADAIVGRLLATVPDQ
jgi:MoxR-like ATPase